MLRQIVRPRVVLAVLAVLLALTGLIVWQLVWPATSPPDQADVVLVLAGGMGEREAMAARLAQEGVARVMVFSDGGGRAAARASRCRLRLDGVRVICLTPRSPNTRGEVRAFAELAAREGWRSVALVTSRYHIRRARLLMGRCYRGTIHSVGAVPSGGERPDMERVAVHEVAAVLAAVTVQRGC